MDDLAILRYALAEFAELDEHDFNLSATHWKIKTFRKGEFYNPVGNICRYLGFIMDGYFRAYLTDEEGNEKNIFLFLPHQVVVTYKSYLHQVPCDYDTQALTMRE